MLYKPVMQILADSRSVCAEMPAWRGLLVAVYGRGAASLGVVPPAAWIVCDSLKLQWVPEKMESLSHFAAHPH